MTLTDDIAAYLAEHGESTYLEVARGIGRRDVTVSDALKDTGRFYSVTRADGRIVYGVASAATGSGGKPVFRAGSDCARLLAVLSDGRKHDHLSLYRLGMIVHSRVADLRARGFRVEMTRDGDCYYYQLVPLTEGDRGNPVSPLPLGPDPGSPSVSGDGIGDTGGAAQPGPVAAQPPGGGTTVDTPISRGVGARPYLRDDVNDSNVSGSPGASPTGQLALESV